MGSITKCGDHYLGKQLIHGARAFVSRAKKAPPHCFVGKKLSVTKPFTSGSLNLDITLSPRTLSRDTCFFRGQRVTRNSLLYGHCCSNKTTKEPEYMQAQV
jgi:hypothetical protein